MCTTKRINSKYIDTGTSWLIDHCILIDKQGKIERICPQTEADTLNREHEFEEELNYPHALLMPGCVNTHSHAFQVLLRPSTGQPQHFQDWVDRFLYPLVQQLDEDSLYASALLVFSQMLKQGITTVGEFFYLHNLPDGSSSRQRNAQAVIQAAKDLGMRISLIRALYDQGQKEGQKRFIEPWEQAIEQTRQLAQQYKNHKLVSVLPAPHSLHGASAPLIQAAAQLAQELNTPWHIHLAEQKSDLELAQSLYGTTPVGALEQLGVLDAQTVLVHAIWLSEADKDLVAQQHAGIAYNPITNMALGDGVADLPGWVKRRVSVGLGTDANIQTNLFAEARSAEYLQRIQSLSMGCVPAARSLFRMLHLQGGKILGLPTGELKMGMEADLIVVDLEHPSMLPAVYAQDVETAVLNQLIFSAWPESALKAVMVGGETVVSEGQLRQVKEEDLREEIQKILK
jgi:5-methylthioadenosine/S-adenosylhomocysteine deaminase